MQYSKYIGHASQIAGVEEHRLVGGKGDGLRLFEAKNGLGLACTVVPDRAADIYRLSFRGYNMGYFSPSGYVAPAYYERKGAEWLRSFTAGFLTTCGLTNAGGPEQDEIDELGLHGSIANTPAEQAYWEQTEDALIIKAKIRDARLFGRNLELNRVISISTKDNTLIVTDTVENHADVASPVMLLYHMNMGYPLLSENAKLEIASNNVTARSEHAAKDLDTWFKVLPPTAGFEEQCYFHSFETEGKAKIFNPEIGVGLSIHFDPKVLPCFCQWKMMGEHAYVMGLEPGNCLPRGQSGNREEGLLQTLQPGESKTYQFTVRFHNGLDSWEKA